MGREIRKVPSDWQHPTKECDHYEYQGKHGPGKQCYQPLFDKGYLAAAAEWKKGFLAWENGQRQDDCEFWEWEGNPPDPEYYRPDWPEDTRTHFQVYETVSEGTPVSPVFASLEELADWLVSQGYSRRAAEAFCKIGWAPSMVMSGGVIYSDIESSAAMGEKP